MASTASAAPSTDDGDLPDAAQLAHTVAQLDGRQRDALAMHFYQGLDYDAVAHGLGCSVGNARVIVHRALERLRQRLGRAGYRVTATALLAALAARAQSASASDGGAFLAGLAVHPPIAPVLVTASTAAKVSLAAVGLWSLAIVTLTVIVLALVGIGEGDGRRTMNRMEEVLDKLALIGLADGDTAYRLRRDGMRIDMRWGSLRSVLTTAIDPAEPRALPPNLRLRPLDPAAGTLAAPLANRTCWLIRDPHRKSVRAGPASLMDGDADFYTDGDGWGR